MLRIEQLRKLRKELLAEEGAFYSWAANIIDKEIKRREYRKRRPEKKVSKQLKLL